MTTHFPNGITNLLQAHPMKQLAFPHPARAIVDFEEFLKQALADWTVTKIGAGTNVLTAGDGGRLLITNAGANGDTVAYQRTVANLRLDKKRDAFFEAKLELSDVVNSLLVVGMQALDSTPFAVSDGIYFNKINGSASVDLAIFKAAAGSVAAVAAVAALVNATQTKLQWYYDASAARLYYGQDDVVKGYTEALTNFPDTVDLTMSFALQNGAAAAKAMTVDYVMAGRNRF